MTLVRSVPQTVRRFESVFLDEVGVRPKRASGAVGDEPVAVEQKHAWTGLQDQ